MKPVVTFFSIPFIILTLGLFLLVINALMLMLTAWIAGRSTSASTSTASGPRSWRLDRDHARQLGHRRHAAQGRRLDRADRSRRRARPGGTRVALVCLGNICRSPTAHVVLEARLADGRASTTGSPCAAPAPATGTSAGRWTSGPRPPSSTPGTTRAGTAPGSTTTPGPPSDDLVLAMDHDNLADLGGRSDRVALFRDFDPVGAGEDVPDPYYGGADGFARGAGDGRAHLGRPGRRARPSTPRTDPYRKGPPCRRLRSPTAPPPLLREPNPAVIAVVMPSGHPMSVATWYLVEDDGTVLVNMDAGRARLGWMRAAPARLADARSRTSEWYTHVSVRGPVVRWEHDEAKALADIDRLSRHYGGEEFGNRDGEAGQRLDPRSTAGTAGRSTDRIPVVAGTGRAVPYYRGAPSDPRRCPEVGAHVPLARRGPTRAPPRR